MHYSGCWDPLWKEAQHLHNTVGRLGALRKQSAFDNPFKYLHDITAAVGTPSIAEHLCNTVAKLGAL